jgi:hypothetical protein
MEYPLTKWLLLPPHIRAQIINRTDAEGILPLNLSSPGFEALSRNPNRAKELWRVADSIWAHLESDRPGWGVWPQEVSESLSVGLFLGIIISEQADMLVTELPEEDLAQVEDECKERGICFEQYLIEQILERKALE